MTDYVTGAAGSYPSNAFGSHCIGMRTTTCEPKDFAGLSANVLAIPGLPITVLSASPVKVSEEFFGMHVQKRVNDALPAISAKTIRSHDSGLRWNQIETSAGVFNWTNLDSWVNTHNALGRQLMFVLFGTPVFYSARPSEVGPYSPGLQAEPSDMTKWDAFCTALATRYKGRIQYYEVWNEPNYANNGTTLPNPTTSCFFTGTWTKLSEMVRRANIAIKAADPAAKIVSPAVQGWAATANASDDYFVGMMAAASGDGSTAMKDWIDIVAVHLYLPSGNIVQDLALLIARVNASKATAGVSALKTWDTESAPIGVDVSALNDAQANNIIGRAMLTMAALGIDRTFYYQYDHATMGYIKRPQIEAYREMIAKLLQSGRILTLSRFTDGRVAYYTESGLTII